VASGVADVGLAYDMDGETILPDELFAIAAHASQWQPSRSRVPLAALGRVPFIRSASGCAPMIEALFA
jgi:hypothetical protein